VEEQKRGTAQPSAPLFYFPYIGDSAAADEKSQAIWGRAGHVRRCPAMAFWRARSGVPSGSRRTTAKKVGLGLTSAIPGPPRRGPNSFMVDTTLDAIHDRAAGASEMIQLPGRRDWISPSGPGNSGCVHVTVGMVDPRFDRRPTFNIQGWQLRLFSRQKQHGGTT
jgi:hypothetical protein